MPKPRKSRIKFPVDSVQWLPNTPGYLYLSQYLLDFYWEICSNQPDIFSGNFQNNYFLDRFVQNSGFIPTANLTGGFIRNNKEKSHVVDYRRNSICSMVAWLFRSEHQSKFSTNRQLGSCSDCYCDHTGCFEPAWGSKPLSLGSKFHFFNLIMENSKTIHHPDIISGGLDLWLQETFTLPYGKTRSQKNCTRICSHLYLKGMNNSFQKKRML